MSVYAPTTLLAVFAGGGIGCVLRYIIGVSFNKSTVNVFPYHTLFANIVACFVIGVVVSLFLAKAGWASELKMFLSVGFCGGLSTLSTFSVEIVTLINNHNYLVAIGYFSVSIIGALFATIIGIILGGYFGRNI